MNDDTVPAQWVALPVPERIPTGAAGLSKIANLHGRLRLAISRAAGNLYGSPMSGAIQSLRLTN